MRNQQGKCGWFALSSAHSIRQLRDSNNWGVERKSRFAAKSELTGNLWVAKVSEASFQRFQLAVPN